MEEEMNCNNPGFRFKFIKALNFFFRAFLFCDDEMNEELKYMRRAISLAKKGVGWVNPNPLVGAVLVKDNRIIGEGYHEFFGGPHAEVNAISNASEPVEGSALFVTLEPCTHQGKTPPCVPQIVEKGIQKVVIGIPDPNPEVHGKGIEYLSSRGIEVRTGVLRDEISRMNEVFIKYITTKKPFCILKTAMSLDGKTATVTGESKWISGEKSRRFVHDLRHMVRGLLVGVDTVIHDDPVLNTRRKGTKSRDPLKIIADTYGRIPLESRVLTSNPQLTILATTELAPGSKIREVERLGAQTIICPLKREKPDLAFLFRSLGNMGVDSILVESGGTLAFSVLSEELVDKVITFVSPKFLGGKLAPTPLGGAGIEKISDAIKLKEWNVRKYGEDFLIEGYISR
jgi:diaminohydroxyphosphoribosylaminopyrimidine deaminase / 5-amino-6-(5-phosphoribosylamino)uracil reductase